MSFQLHLVGLSSRRQTHFLLCHLPHLFGGIIAKRCFLQDLLGDFIETTFPGGSSQNIFQELFQPEDRQKPAAACAAITSYSRLPEGAGPWKEWGDRREVKQGPPDLEPVEEGRVTE